jgi:predicted Fe-Mo cluster-binding NifX family protein
MSDTTSIPDSTKSVRIAIPMTAGTFCPHFGAATEFLLFDGIPATGRILDRRILTTPDHQPGVLPKWLANHNTEVVVASAIGERALIMLAEAGIETRLAADEMTPNELAVACLQGKLPRVNRENSRCNGGHHDHGHDHSQGHQCHH